MNWYIVQAYTGKEQDAILSLANRKEQMKAEDKFGSVKMPVENNEKLYKGYIFIEMELCPASRRVIRETPNLYGFAGPGDEPTTISEERIREITQESQINKSKKGKFGEGDKVKITNGPFEGMEAEIEEIGENDRVEVLVDIFERQTQVTLSMDDIEEVNSG